MGDSTPPLVLSFAYNFIGRKTFIEFYIQTFTVYTSRYSNSLRVGRPRGRISSSGRVKNFLLSTSSRPALGPTQPPIQWVPGLKRTGRETNHSPPASAEVKKMWLYTSTSRVARLEEELDKDAVCHHFYSTYIVNTLPRKLIKVLETSKLEDK
jgi:hypothetical protein